MQAGRKHCGCTAIRRQHGTRVPQHSCASCQPSSFALQPTSREPKSGQQDWKAVSACDLLQHLGGIFITLRQRRQQACVLCLQQSAGSQPMVSHQGSRQSAAPIYGAGILRVRLRACAVKERVWQGLGKGMARAWRSMQVSTSTEQNICMPNRGRALQKKCACQ